MSQKGIAKCALCHKKKKLCRSHIIPEFFYKPIYDGPFNRYFVLSTDPKETTYPRQVGFRERLLCEECDKSVIGRVEDYGAKVLYGGIEIHIRRFPHMFITEGLDYDKFKLFTMSLLWRASVTKLPQFAAVNIKPYEETMRQMLLNGDSGEEYEFGCAIIGSPEIFSLSGKLIMPPNIEVIDDGLRYYRFILGGLAWFFFLTRKADQAPYEEIFLTKSGALPIYVDHNFMPKDFLKFATQLQTAGKLDRFKTSQ